MLGASNVYDSLTSTYTKVTVSDPKYLNIAPLSDQKYLPLYRSSMKGHELDEGELMEYFNRIQGSLSEALDADFPQYKLTTNSAGSSRAYLTLSGANGTNPVSFGQDYAYEYTVIHEPYASRMDGEPIAIDPARNDDEIIASMVPVKERLCEIFGCDFQGAKVNRWSSSITVTFFKSVSTGPSTQSRYTFGIPTAKYYEYVELSFQYDSSDAGLLYCSYIRCYTLRDKAQATDEVYAYAPRISLREAETLLYKGYVLTGPVCNICMSMQEEIDFHGYDHVNMIYIYGTDPNGDTEIAIPFYVFYKQIGTDKRGNLVYAQTSVPAIQISGYKEYFQEQSAKHQHNRPGIWGDVKNFWAEICQLFDQ